MKYVLNAVLFSIAILTVSASYDTVLNTTYGPLIGLVQMQYPTVRAFLGIPYAKPPKRFHRSVAPSRWYKPRNAVSFSAACPQFEFFLDQSEDCLYANVYTPSVERIANKGKLLPVAVWLYGGAFVLGSGSEHKIYDGSFLVSNNDMILVTFNYRVGPLGFLVTEKIVSSWNASTANLEQEVLSPNVGLYDQLRLFRWINETIKDFGGDPSRITIMGQSAGALSGLIHLTSPISSSFHQAILQSSPLSFKFRTLKEASEQIGRKFIAKTGCRSLLGDSEYEFQCLMNQPIWKLYLHTPTAIPLLSPDLQVAKMFGWFPVVDNLLVKVEDPAELPSQIGNKRSTRRIILGTNRDEGSIVSWIIDAVLNPFFGCMKSKDRCQWIWNRFTYQYMVKFVFKAKHKGILAHYPNMSRWIHKHGEKIDYKSRFFGLLSDYGFHCPTVKVLNDLRKWDGAREKPIVYQYSFEFVPQYLQPFGGVCSASKVCHAVELPYVFHGLNQLITFSPDEEKLSEIMMNQWSNFIKGGKMDNNWREFSGNTRPYVKITGEGLDSLENYRAEQCRALHKGLSS